MTDPRTPAIASATRWSSPQTEWDARPRPCGQSSRNDLVGNDDVELTIRVPAGRELEFDFPGIRIGSAEYAEGPTGATVIELGEGARTATDARGGAVGLTGAYPWNHALSFAGGSVQGIAAATGVTDAIQRERGNPTGFADLALVSGAVIYDFALRDNAIAPDAALGRAAWDARREGRVALGAAGAGVGASVGKTRRERIERSGQGAAFWKFGDVRILAFAVVNSVGVVVDRDGTVLRGNVGEDGSRRHPVVDALEMLDGGEPAAQQGNTTISALITNVRLPDIELAQLGRQVHASMHRGIQPFATMFDGDVLFTATTDEVDLPEGEAMRILAGPVALGAIASEVMWDAVIEAAR